MIKRETLKRVLVLLLACVMVLATFAFVGCSDPEDPEKKPEEKEDPGEKKEDERIPLDLPAKDFSKDGEKAAFHVLEWSCNNVVDVGVSWIPWEEIDVDDMDGDQISQVVFKRNSSVQEKYNVDIDKEYVSYDYGFPDRVRTNHTTGDDEFQLITFRTTGVAHYIEDGYLTDLNEYADTIFHFDQPWWVADSIKSFTLGDHLYLASSEMLLRDKGATAAVFFNQRIVKENNFGNIYEMVENKDWTMEEVVLMCDNIVNSLDGDDLMNSVEDMWGVECGDDPVYYLFNGFGHKFAHSDEAGYIAWDFGTDSDPDSIMIMKEIFDDFMYQEWVTNLKGLDPTPFPNGHCLFKFGLVKDVVTSLRNMEDDYGIVPCPLYSSDQESYSSLVWMHHDCVLGIPSATADPEMSAFIVEALSWEGYYSVYPKFYDTVLMDRSTRDDESKAMLRIIFETRSFDPGQYWDDATGEATGLHGGDGLLRLTAKGTSDIASLWARFKDKVQANVDHLNEWIDS